MNLNFVYKFVLLMSMVLATDAMAANACGSLQPDNNYGPYDYTNGAHFQNYLPRVEAHHFNSGVENLVSGQTGHISKDLDYVLKTFPNHHRALWSMARYQIREGSKAGMRFSPECYFERALRLKPDDGVVVMISAIYLHRAKKPDEALRSYDLALEMLPESAELHYNKGLLHFDLKQYEQAEFHALEAYSRGYPLPGLKNKLTRVKGNK